jgi:hypothetical protein
MSTTTSDPAGKLSGPSIPPFRDCRQWVRIPLAPSSRSDRAVSSAEDRRPSPVKKYTSRPARSVPTLGRTPHWRPVPFTVSVPAAVHLSTAEDTFRRFDAENQDLAGASADFVGPLADRVDPTTNLVTATTNLVTSTFNSVAAAIDRAAAMFDPAG